MKIERTKNATRNIIFGCILKLYQIIIPFFMRTAMLYVLGAEFLGLNSLFVSVLQVLNLAELGVGSAMVYSMYKPITIDDTSMICALMKLYRLYYRIIGWTITFLGLLFLPFIPKLILGSIPEEVNIFVLYILNLTATIVSYWLYAYKNCLLEAHQRNDINSKITIMSSTIQYILQLIALIRFKNYYLFLAIALFSQIITNLITAMVVERIFPKYKPIGTLKKKEIRVINRRIKDLFTSKIGAAITNSVDTIVISAFLGLTTLATYQNYFYIINSISSFMSILFNSCMAGIGNSLIVETKQKNYNDLKKFTFITLWIAGFCSCCLLVLYQQFMKIWVGDKYILNLNIVILLCVYFFINQINQLLLVYKDAAGIWHQDRFRPLITSFTNLGLNLIMVQFIGLYGVILSTVLSMVLIGTPWLLHNLFYLLFERHFLFNYLKRLIYYICTTIFAAIMTYMISRYIHFNVYIGFFVKFIICLIVPNVIFYIAYHKMPEFIESIRLIDRITKGRFMLEKYILNWTSK